MAVALPLPMAVHRSLDYETFKNAQQMSTVLQQLVLESGGDFRAMEPVMQALVQAAALTMVVNAHIKANAAPVWSLLQVVPLLAARGYDLIFRQLLSGELSPEVARHFAACSCPCGRAQL